METSHLTIREHPFFRGMSERALKSLTAGAREGEFAAGEIIFHEGEYADHFFLIQSGKVALEPGAAPRENVIIQVLGPGEALGWSWLFPPFRWHLQARAIEPTRAIVLNAAHMLIACEEDHDLGYDVMKRVSHLAIERLKAARRHIIELHALPHRPPNIFAETR